MNARYETRSQSRTWLAGRLIPLVVGAAIILAGCSGLTGPKIVSEGVWARPVAPMATGMPASATPAGGSMMKPGADMGMGQGGQTSAVYMTLRNEGRDADRLVAASTAVAATAELHESKLEGGVMRMSPVPGIDVPAGGRVDLKPGGYHVMLIGINREVKVGDRFTVTLQFERSGAVTVEAEVRQP